MAACTITDFAAVFKFLESLWILFRCFESLWLSLNYVRQNSTETLYKSLNLAIGLLSYSFIDPSESARGIRRNIPLRGMISGACFVCCSCGGRQNFSVYWVKSRAVYWKSADCFWKSPDFFWKSTDSNTRLDDLSRASRTKPEGYNISRGNISSNSPGGGCINDIFYEKNLNTEENRQILQAKKFLGSANVDSLRLGFRPWYSREFEYPTAARVVFARAWILYHSAQRTNTNVLPAAVGTGEYTLARGHSKSNIKV